MTEEVTVSVETPEPPDEPAPEAPAVVVVNTDDEPAPGNTDAVVELATRVGALEAWRESMTAQVEDVEDAAEAAQATAEFAEDIAIASVETSAEVAEDVAEETAEEVVEDEPPSRVHWTHRPLGEWFGGNR